MTVHVELRRGMYADSVALMLVAQRVQARDDVDGAVVAMATDLNLELLSDQGFAVPDGATPNDLLVAVRTSDAAGIEGALATLESALAATRQGGDSGGLAASPPHSTTASAAAVTGAGGIALISVPGLHAYVEAVDALRAGMHPMIFSDNVPVEQEVALKVEAATRGLLVMGPDCGTAIIGGVGLGFTNVVQPGPVSIVAASGTGAQQVCALLDDAGIGVRHVMGVGGRDLSDPVGGRSTIAGLEALAQDRGTEAVVLVSKPPASAVARRINDLTATFPVPVTTCFVGGAVGVGGVSDRGDGGGAGDGGGDGGDLSRVVAAVQTALGRTVHQPTSWPAPVERRHHDGQLRGVFAGGTLCEEAMGIAAPTLGGIGSNIPLAGGWPLPPDLRAEGHIAIDFGDDLLTRGRPHPMIDQSLRVTRILEEAHRAGNHVLLLDVVLGHGAHADPAGELAPCIRRARAIAANRGDDLAVVVSLCGTIGDPQGRDAQAARLVAAGASVHLSNAQAARTAIALLRPETGQEVDR